MVFESNGGAEMCTCGVRETRLSGKLRVSLTVHVDDGLLLGKRFDPIFQKIKQLIFEQFDVERSGRSQGSGFPGFDAETRSWWNTGRHAQVRTHKLEPIAVNSSGQMAR